MSERPTWRDRYPEGEVTCMRCLQVKDVMELDRLLWCLACRVRARERAAWYGWIGGIAFALVLAVWVWFSVRPSDMIVGAWVATFAAAVWIGAKVSRELVYGAMRYQNSPAAEARPPRLAADESGVEDRGGSPPEGPGAA